MDLFKAMGISASGLNAQRTMINAVSMNLANVRARLVVRSVVDQAGKRIFADGDAEMLGDKSAAAVARVFDVAQRLSGMRPEDLDELVGKSAPGPVDASPSASPGSSAA